MKILIAMLGLLLGAQVEAQQTYKCKDAAGKITYSSRECSQLGLDSAGEVTGRITVQPAIKVAPAAPAPPPPPAAAAKDDASASKASAAAKDPNAPPERRCFSVKTAKGTSTRCNDVPEE